MSMLRQSIKNVQCQRSGVRKEAKMGLTFSSSSRPSSSLPSRASCAQNLARYLRTERERHGRKPRRNRRDPGVNFVAEETIQGLTLPILAEARKASLSFSLLGTSPPPAPALLRFLSYYETLGISWRFYIGWCFPRSHIESSMRVKDLPSMFPLRRSCPFVVCVSRV